MLDKLLKRNIIGMIVGMFLLVFFMKIGGQNDVAEFLLILPVGLTVALILYKFYIVSNINKISKMRTDPSNSDSSKLENQIDVHYCSTNNVDEITECIANCTTINSEFVEENNLSNNDINIYEEINSVKNKKKFDEFYLHKNFGLGKVIGKRNDIVFIAFEGVGIKRFKINDLNKFADKVIPNSWERFQIEELVKNELQYNIDAYEEKLKEEQNMIGKSEDGFSWGSWPKRSGGVNRNDRWL